MSKVPLYLQPTWSHVGLGKVSKEHGWWATNDLSHGAVFPMGMLHALFHSKWHYHMMRFIKVIVRFARIPPVAQKAVFLLMHIICCIIWQSIMYKSYVLGKVMVGKSKGAWQEFPSGKSRFNISHNPIISFAQLISSSDSSAAALLFL